MSLDDFLAVDFGWTRQLPSIWSDGAAMKQTLHTEVLRQIIADLDLLRESSPPARSRLGHAIVGTAGSGKTHLMGSLRREAVANRYWFVLLDFGGITDFWRSAALGFVSSLLQRLPDGRSQFHRCLVAIAKGDRFGAFRERYRSVNPRIEAGLNLAPQERADLVSLFLQAMRGVPDSLKHQHVMRAYLQLQLGDFQGQNCAYAWLQGLELETEMQTATGLPKTISPREVVAGTLWMLGCVAPTVIAIDQIDAIVAEQNLAPTRFGNGEDGQGLLHSIVESLASGLMGLYDLQSRSKTVIACLEATWNVLTHRVTLAVTDRFLEPVLLRPIGTSARAEELVCSRLAMAYESRHFTPPYPTWPIRPSAFAAAVDMWPRVLLKKCEAYRAKCRAEGKVTELLSFEVDVITKPPKPVDGFEAKFAKFRQSADIVGLTDEAREDDLRQLMTDALRLYAKHAPVAEDVDVAVSDAKSMKRPPLHARLTFTFRAAGERERHYCFRAIPQTNAVAFQARLRAAMTESGAARALAFRHLVVVRRGPVPQGARTAELLAQFQSVGGVFVDPSEDELRTLRALVALKEDPGLDAWLKTARPFAEISLFSKPGLHLSVNVGNGEKGERNSKVDGQVAGGVLPPAVTPGPAPSSSGDAPRLPAANKAAADSIPVGRRLEGGKEGREAALPIPVLPRHTAVLAGAGAGKTVLLRRLVEESALLGIPALILDSNNDLTTLGDPWPEPPAQWSAVDAEKAKLYRERTDVVVWTPGLSRGRPITLDVLPDFGALGAADADEIAQAVNMALSTISSLVKLSELKKGVLADALRTFAAAGGRTLDSFVALLGDLPLDASQIGRAQKLAAEAADQLRAAIATNPLLRGGGSPLNPAAFFSSDRPDRTRVSIVSLVGLPSDESRQEFVNRLQMSLFTWIKKVPSSRPRLYVIDEARNFVPSSKPAACKDSAISLAAQARKYGLGLIFATQSPRDIDNKIISNCTTHFYGKMNSPAAIDTIRELIAAKGGNASDIATLQSGTFYFSTEGSGQPVKIKTALCLSHHAPNPPGTEEVIRRASGAAEAVAEVR